MLVAAGIPCTYILINSLSYVMKEVSKVLLGACAMLANGNVISRAGSSMVALMAKQVKAPLSTSTPLYLYALYSLTASLTSILSPHWQPLSLLTPLLDLALCRERQGSIQALSREARQYRSGKAIEQV